MEAVLTGNGRQGNNRLRMPKRLFAPTQTIVRAYPNDCSPIRKRLNAYTQIEFKNFFGRDRGCKEGAHLLKGMHPTQTPIPTGLGGKRGAGCRVFLFLSYGIDLLKMHYYCVFTYFFHFYCHFCLLHTFTWNYKCGSSSDFVIVHYFKFFLFLLNFFPNFAAV